MTARIAPIGELVEPVATWNPASQPENRFSYIDLSAIDQVEKRIIAANVVSGAEAPSRARQLICTGDVLISTVRPNLNGVAPVTEEFDGATASTGFCVLRPDVRKLDSSYLAYWVCSPTFVESMVREATGASYPAVSDRIIKASKIPLPSISEQRRIAAILDKVDALRRKRKWTLNLLSSLTQSVFIQIFGDPQDNPKRWQSEALGKLCDVRDGTHDSPKYVEVGHPLLTSKNFSQGKLDYTGSQMISGSDFTEINKRSRVDVGDIVMPMIGTIGSPVLITNIPDFAIKNLALFKVRNSLLSAEYLLAILNGNLLRDAVAKNGRGGTQKFLSLGDLRALEIPIPPEGNQRLFKKYTCRHAMQTEQLVQAMHITDKFFISLQSRAFSGQL